MITKTIKYSGSTRIPLDELLRFIGQITAATSNTRERNVIIKVGYHHAPGRDPRESDAVTLSAEVPE